MTKSIIWQLWQQYKETKDSKLLAQAVEAADFSDDLNRNKEIQSVASAFIRQHTRSHKFETSVRNDTIRMMHEANMSQGLSVEQSYRAIKRKFDEWAAETDQEDYVHTTISTEAIRKILK